MRRGSACQEGSVPASLHRGEVAGFEARRGVADPKNTAMSWDQAAVAQAGLDFGLGDTGSQQLAASHDTVCLVRQLGEDRFDCPVWGRTTTLEQDGQAIRPGQAPFIAGFDLALARPRRLNPPGLAPLLREVRRPRGIAQPAFLVPAG